MGTDTEAVKQGEGVNAEANEVDGWQYPNRILTTRLLKKDLWR